MECEIDLNKFTKTDIKVKLYDCVRYTVISFVEYPDEPYLFCKVDGMYSICKFITGESKGEIFHPAAWSDVFLWSVNERTT